MHSSSVSIIEIDKYFGDFHVLKNVVEIEENEFSRADHRDVGRLFVAHNS